MNFVERLKEFGLQFVVISVLFTAMIAFSLFQNNQRRESYGIEFFGPCDILVSDGSIEVDTNHAICFIANGRTASSISGIGVHIKDRPSFRYTESLEVEGLTVFGTSQTEFEFFHDLESGQYELELLDGRTVIARSTLRLHQCSALARNAAFKATQDSVDRYVVRCVK